MKTILGLLPVLFFAVAARAQAIEDVVAAGCGGGQTAAGVRYEWLLGELMTEFYADGISLDQGFGPAPCFTVSTHQVGAGPAISIAAYPNPATNFLHVEGYSDQPFTAMLYDMHGQLLLRQESEDGRTGLLMTPFPPGPYVLAIWTGNQMIKSFIIQKFH